MSLSIRLRRERIAALPICDRCGATPTTWAQACRAGLDQPCPGFRTIERALLGPAPTPPMPIPSPAPARAPVRVVLTRSLIRPAPGTVLLAIDGRTIARGGTTVRLGRKPFRLAMLLLAAYPAALLHEDMFDAMWGDDPDPPFAKTADVHLNKVRKALRRLDIHVETFCRVGRRLRIDAAEPEARAA